jgi:CheY-like chemotaxis protein
MLLRITGQHKFITAGRKPALREMAVHVGGRHHAAAADRANGRKTKMGGSRESLRVLDWLLIYPAEPEIIMYDCKGQTILVVDDTESLRSFISTFLQEAGYAIIEAAGPAEAIKVFQQRQDFIDLVLTDVQMPGMNGVDLALLLLHLRPGLPVIFLSGYYDALPPPVEAFPLLAKPFEIDDLVRTIKSSLTGCSAPEVRVEEEQAAHEGAA